MRLTSVRLEKVRRFQQSLELNDIGDGINLIFGPNEAGKSTLQAAIAAVFLERPSSQAPQQDLAPSDLPDARPLVSVSFVHEGETFELTKEFYRRGGSCMLRSGSTVLTGDEAVARLVELFRFEAPSSRSITEAQLGLPGVFWVPQGKALGVQAAMDHARGYVVHEIGEEIGSGRETAADALILRLNRSLAEVVTPAGRGGPLVQARRDLEAKRIALDNQEKLEQDSQYLRDRLVQLQAELDTLEAQNVESVLTDDIAAAQRRQEELRRALEERGRVESERAAVEERIADIERNLAQLIEETSRIEQLGKKISEVEVDIANCQEALARHQEQQSVLRHRQEERQTQARWFGLSSDLRERKDQLISLDEQESEIRSMMEGADLLSEQIDELQGRLARLLIGEGSAELAKLETTCVELRARLQTLSTQVIIDVDEANRLLVDGKPEPISRTLFLEESMVIEVPGVARISLLPQESAARLRQELEWSQADLAQRLRAIGVASVVELSERELEHGQLSAELVSLIRERARLVGEGDSPQARLNGIERKRERVLAQLGTIESELLLITAANPGDEEELALSQEEADALIGAVAFHATEIDRLEAELRQYRETQLRSSEEMRWLTVSVQRQGGEQGATDMRTSLEDLAAKRQEIEDRLRDIEVLIGSGDLRAIDDDITLSNERLRAHRSQVTQYREERQEVLGRIRADLFSEEELASAQVALEQAQTLVAALEERSEALNTLINIAKEIVADVQQDLSAPLKERVGVYANQLFKDAVVEIDESFAPSRLVRGRANESIGQLSWGTREQLALLTRLGVADLMAERGVPVFLMLDDAILNADGVRLIRLKQILVRAAQRYQILIFSCRPEFFSDLPDLRRFDLGAISSTQRS
ncbi:AAA family ATPase [Ferrimicrobium acidiphilum]|uniref:AAA family ATPase n=1 Tax=Ferrimicrobium acidiphilum TaxID=121039 RepID=UPI0023F25BE7|nr:AAA family ATPase [Ferrimicrobium acidiphilum]